MSILYSIKWTVAPKEMAELERWEVQWYEVRRGFAEFPVAASALEHLRGSVKGVPSEDIHSLRNYCRALEDAKVATATRAMLLPTQADGTPIDLADLWIKLHNISKAFEGSDVCHSDGDNGYYAAILDAMVVVRSLRASGETVNSVI